jgi:hypothetical protein
MDLGSDQSGASARPVRYRLVPRYLVRKKDKKPLLALDVSRDDVWVIDLETTALAASASLAQVTAKPAQCKHKEYENESTTTWKQPVLVLGVPGLEPLIIGTHETKHSKWGGHGYLYVWGGKVGRADKPGYHVEEREWRELAEKFGLGALVVDRLASGDIERKERRGKITGIAGGVVFVLVLALGWMANHFGWLHHHVGM